MGSCEAIAHVVGGSSWLGIKLESFLCSNFWQSSLRKLGCETLEKLAIAGRDLVINLTRRGPHCVCNAVRMLLLLVSAIVKYLLQLAAS